jgi:hypothetical protein
MNDDRLSEAVRALREETSCLTGAGELTRARIMASVRETRRQRMRAVMIVVPLAAVLVAGTALATATGKMPEAWQRLWTGLTERAEEPSKGVPVGGPQGQPDPEQAPAPEPDAAVEGEAIDLAKPGEPKAGATAGVSGRGPGASVSAPLPRKDSDPQELYREAHRAHFQQGDCVAAIAAYERYLAAAPRGRFAAEASYNRALCLVRAGRTPEAKAALQPFAEGRHGGYRRAEAQALLDALGAREAAAESPNE